MDANANTQYDKFISLGAWVGAFLYGVPAAGILAVCWYFQVSEKFWLPVLLVYCIGAVGHMITYGFTALAVQIKASTDYALEHGKSNANIDEANSHL